MLLPSALDAVLPDEDAELFPCEEELPLVEAELFPLLAELEELPLPVKTELEELSLLFWLSCPFFT